jgi:cytochrome c-type biogenesis protein CcmH/NrfF
MVFKCKNECEKIQVKFWIKKNVYDTHRYCATCTTFMKITDQLRCPCCSNKLRASKRNKSKKEFKRI